MTDGPVVGAIDDAGRCAHWHSAPDVVAIAFACCGVFHACADCHAETADHPARVWPRASFDEPAVRCGVCREPMSIAAYLAADDACPHCGAAFNPGCRLHHDRYFAVATRPDTAADTGVRR